MSNTTSDRLLAETRAARERQLRLPFAVYRCLNQLIMVDEQTLQTSDAVSEDLLSFLTFFKTVYEHADEYPEAFWKEDMPKILERDVMALFAEVDLEVLQEVVSRSVRPDPHFPQNLATRMLWRAIRELDGRPALPPNEVTSRIIRWELRAESLRAACKTRNVKKLKGVLALEDAKSLEALGVPFRHEAQWAWAELLFALASPAFDATDRTSQASITLQGAEIVTTCLKFMALDSDSHTPPREVLWKNRPLTSRPDSPVLFRMDV